MKIFSWMQSKVNGKQVTKQPNVIPSNRFVDNRPPPQAPCKEEFSDWPQALFSIGTFGNNTLKEDPERLNPKESQVSSSHDYPQDMSPEEIKELEKYLQEKSTNAADESETLNQENDCDEEDSVNKDMNLLQRNGSVVMSRGKDIFLDSTNNAIGKKSLTFLLKKMFICSSGFSHGPNLRDSLPEVKIEKSRMEKLLRALLHKKIYPQSSTPKGKKYLERNNTRVVDGHGDDEMSCEGNDGSKWVKTDSEYIVLEI